MDILQAQIQAMKAKRAAQSSTSAASSTTPQEANKWVKQGDLEKRRQEEYRAEQKKAEDARAQKE